MSLPYLPRLLLLCLASLFLVYLAAGAVAALLAPIAVRLAHRMNPRAGARLLLAMRLAPSLCGLFAVLALCVPAYVWHEPEALAERVGFGCLAAACLGAALWIGSLTRAACAVARSSRFVNRYLRASRTVRLAGQPLAVSTFDAGPPMMLAGLMRPRLLVARAVLESLTEAQLAAALLHERAHADSKDNLKRLLLAATPGFRSLKVLESGWARLAEWAADDRVAEMNPEAGATLAAALVRVARLDIVNGPPPLVTNLTSGSEELSARVERLLRPASKRESPTWLYWTAGVAGCTAAVAIAFQPGILEPVHRILEQMLR